MSKIDEIKKEIKQIYLHEYNVLEKYYAVIEQLRPYIEYAEFVRDNIRDMEFGSMEECLTYNDLSSKIREQEK
jgi:hypothetical protein